MTPAARISAAIEILDAWQGGEAVEKLLTTWARRSRFAGSKDRAAVRDLVFSALRNLNSFAVLGGANGYNDATGRELMAGLLRAQGDDPAALFTGEGYAPDTLAGREAVPGDLSGVYNLPEWLLPGLKTALGPDFDDVERLMRGRASLFLRVNSARAAVSEVIEKLDAEGITARPHPLALNALEVTENPRKFANSDVFRTGLAEIQDVASQAVSDLVPLPETGGRVLDFCAGGGGKALALAARTPQARIFAHDISAPRMKDIPERARRAGAKITVLQYADLNGAPKFDVVLADAPCSGSGAWRRNPEGKWRLTSGRLSDLNAMQDDVLTAAAQQVRPGGVLAYATCSLLPAENQDRVRSFLASHPGWDLTLQKQFTPLDGGDGFYLAIMSAPLTGE